MEWEKTSDLCEWMASERSDDQALPKVVLTRWSWHKAAAGRNRKRYAITELAAAGAAAAIPVATTAGWNSLIVALLGSTVLVATGVRTTFQLHENWIEHTKVRQGIEFEASLFLTASPPYEGYNATRTLVLRVENITYNWGQRWAARRNRHGQSDAADVTK